VPPTKVVALAPDQVAVLLDAADRATSPWLGTWTVLAAATGARNGELCGLEWVDLDLDAGTVRFRQALTIIDPAVLPDTAAMALRWVEPGRSPRVIQLDLVFRTERSTPVNPNHASRAFAQLAASAGLVAHPHMLRHALASAMTANKEPASRHCCVCRERAGAGRLLS
jgi:integrase